jgi:PAS domain S-box-containing protein
VVFNADLNLNTTWVSPSVEKMFGETPEEHIKRPLHTKYPPKTLQKMQQFLIKEFELDKDPSVSKNRSRVLEHEFLKTDGTLVCVSTHASFIRDSDGNPIGIQGVTRDITDKKNAEKKLIEQNEFVNSLLRAIPVAVFYKDKEGKYIGCNKVFTEYIGVTNEQIKGKTVYELWPSEMAKIYHQKDLELIFNPQHQEYEYEVKDKNGNNRPVIFVKDVFYDSNGEVAGLVGAFLDISERKQHEEELASINEELTVTTDALKESNQILAEAKEKAEESDRLKSVFLANVSHEIRTPMNAIIGFLELLKKPDLEGDKAKSYIEIVNQSGLRLLQTINDIIEISKLEAKQVHVTYSDVDIDDLMQFHSKFFENQAKAKGIKIVLNNQKTQNIVIRTDKKKIDGLFTNLIGNAIKFTDEGFIEIGSFYNDYTITFYVKDTGRGIPNDRLQAIFDRFVQADLATTRTHEGSGLGLSICNAYLHLLGGSIWVESELGKGSTFYFSIPYEMSSKSEEKSESIEMHSSKCPKGIKVLIAEDDADSYDLLNAILSEEGFCTVNATTGVEAINILKENNDIHLVLMDLKMPQMDGLEATKRIREFNPTIPIIAQTAFALSGDKEKAIEVGCNDYISKPVDFSELLSIVNKHLL